MSANIRGLFRISSLILSARSVPSIQRVDVRSFHPKAKLNPELCTLRGSATKMEYREISPGGVHMPHPVSVESVFRGESHLSAFSFSAIAIGNFSYKSGELHPEEVVDLSMLEKHKVMNGDNAYKHYFLAFSTNEKKAENFLYSRVTEGFHDKKVLSRYSLKGPTTFIDVDTSLSANAPEDQLETHDHAEEEVVAANIPYHQLREMMIYHQDKESIRVENPFSLPSIPEELNELSESIQTKQAYLLYYFCQDKFPGGLSEQSMTQDIVEELSVLYEQYYSENPEKNPLALPIARFVEEHQEYAKGMVHCKFPEISVHDQIPLEELIQKFCDISSSSREDTVLVALQRASIAEHPFLSRDNKRFDYKSGGDNQTRKFSSAIRELKDQVADIEQPTVEEPKTDGDALQGPVKK